jgi:hypothetical protein
MDEHVLIQVPHEAKFLESVSARLRAGEVIGQRELELALERGFGCLIGLKAELRRARDPARTEVSHAGVGELAYWITRISEALIDIRTASSTDGPARVGYGFVLPASPRSAAAREAEGQLDPRSGVLKIR